jgi:transketolase
MSISSVSLSRLIRETTLQMVFEAKASHIGGALSMVDILAVLYEEVLQIDPKQPQSPERDRFLLSKGHACTSLYSTLAIKGFFDLNELKTYSANGSRLLSHTSHKVPGIELSTGSLGHALSVSCGLALAAKRKRKAFHTFCLVSDGELNEGSNWEGILFAPHHKLNNLTLIVDFNKIQSFGTVEEVLNLDPLTSKFEAFGWNVVEIDGHNHEEIYLALVKAKSSADKPTVIVANTVKGKGVSFMENRLLWHYKSPSQDEYNLALKEIKG